MILDNPERFAALDPENMLGHINALPDQLEQAWQLAHDLPLPDSTREVRLIVLAGMGGSAIGGDYFAALVSHASPIPVLVNRGYEFPAYVSGPDVLVIASSNSGNTEETLAAYAQARERGTRLLAITTGGELAARAEADGVPLWQFTYESQPRAAFGWSFGLLAGLAQRLNLAGNLQPDLDETLALLREQAPGFGPDVPTAENAAKRYAGQFAGRIGVIYGSGIMVPVARRWKGQINENAKNWAEFDELPEQNHNGVAGTELPERGLQQLFAMFLRSRYDHPRVTLRQDLTYRLYLQQGIGVDTFIARGESRMAQMLNATQFGDYMSYYLAMLNEVDPTPIPPISALKEGLAQAG
ncbi:MAG: bifunctional phosphoglucose/phosphomannose isomerase [Anaerolineae bacterium]